MTRNKYSGSGSLRQKAEQKHRIQNSGKSSSRTEADTRRLLYELEVHQIELEMQNQELIASEEASRQATEKYTSLYDFAPMGYFTLGPACRITGLNLSGARMAGIERFLLLNVDFRTYVAPESLKDFNNFIHKIFENKAKQVCKVKLNRADGTSMVAHIEGVLSFDEQNCFLTVMDISARELAEEKLRDSEIRLRELNATKDKFFSIIAHDMKSPFTSIIGYSNLISSEVRKKNYGAVGKYAEIIESSSWKAMNLLTNLMDWSRSQTGRMGFNPEFIDLCRLVNDVTDLLKDTAFQKSIAITNIIPQNFVVYADISMLNTIMRNLISNGLKFTDPGGKIEISGIRTDSESVISVKDNGIGIGSEDVEKLFRIETCHSTMGTKGEEGTGLGLLLCDDFIRKHGGKIWVESEKGKGSSFSFTLINKN
jgi:C4-dicarboxylate-specific signal transduction histidine kinase